VEMKESFRFMGATVKLASIKDPIVTQMERVSFDYCSDDLWVENPIRPFLNC